MGRMDVQTWVSQLLGHSDFSMQPLAGDASFRRYIRIKLAHTSYMLMDAPPEKEDSTPFVQITDLLAAGGVNVPSIIGKDLGLGYLLLQDFGDTLLAHVLKADSVQHWYRKALAQLLPLQAIAAPTVAPYDRARLQAEIDLFTQWFVPQLLQLDIDPATNTMLQQTFATIVDACVEQPVVLVHRDYHCRNLMVVEGCDDIGVIDYQDALLGPITYDAVSLLRDAYVVWEPAIIEGLVADFYAMLCAERKLCGVTLADFSHGFNMMAMQRHLKVLGIFVRLKQRDGKSGYMNDLPLVLAYLLSESRLLPELQTFSQWLEQVVVPRYEQVLPEHTAVLQAHLARLTPQHKA